MSEYWLRLSVLADRKVRASYTGGGEVSEIALNYDRLRARTLSILTEGLNRRRRTVTPNEIKEQGEHLLVTRDELELLGEHLFATLFVDAIETKFWEMFERTGRGKQYEKLMVRLVFDEDADDLAELPWEYLRAPSTPNRRGFFLSTQVNLVLSRYLLLDEDDSPEMEAGPLRVLLLVSEPDHVEVEMEQVELDQLEQAIKGAGPIEVETTLVATRTGVMETLEGFRPHVLHVIGQGRTKRGKAQIALIDEEDHGADWVDESTFASLVGGTDRAPAVIVLHLWQPSSDRDQSRLSFDRLAPALVRAHIPAVVAMRHPMSGERALKFNKWFYEKLATGETVEAAVLAARHQLSLLRLEPFPWAFGTPVLYRHEIGGVVMPPAALQEKAPRAMARTGRELGSNGAGAPKPGVGAAPRWSSSTSEEGGVGALEDRAARLIAAGRACEAALGLRGRRHFELVKQLLDLQKKLTGLRPDEQTDYLTSLEAPEDDDEWQEVLNAVIEAALEPESGQ